MKHKKILSLIFGIMFLTGLVYAAALISETFDFVNVEESTAAGNVKVRISDTTRSELQIVKVNIKVWDSHQESEEVFEGWLVDEETGYKLSLGAFETNSVGNGRLKFSQKMVNAEIYDEVVITREPVLDENPTPADAALVAEIDSGEDEIVSLMADLNGAQEVPATNSEGTGSGWFVLNKDENTLSFNISYSGLGSEETGAHIHGPAPVGVDAGILFPLPSENPKIGVWNYDEDQEANILAGLTYVNIHTSEFPGGEIRGQIVLD